MIKIGRGAAAVAMALLIPACMSGPKDPPNGSGHLQFSSAAFSVGEGAGTASIEVTRTGGSAGTVSVLFSVTDGTALTGVDYTMLPGTGMLVWGDGDTAPKTIDLTILNDSVEEGNETVLLALFSPSGAPLGSPASATLTILDDDSSSVAGTLRFEPDTYKFMEGIYPLALLAPNLILVNRVGGSAGDVSVMIVITGGTATQGVDYRLPIPGPVGGALLSWKDGETGLKSVTVDILDDVLTEGRETILLELKNATGGAIIGSPKDATVTIDDDD